MPLTALVVCQDQAETGVLADALAGEGIAVEACAETEDPAARLRAAHFDAVVVDCANLLQAYELMAVMRVAGVNSAALIIGLVGARTNVREILQRGAGFLLYRPLTAERVAAGLKTALKMMKREQRKGQRAKLHAIATISYATVENDPATVLELSEGGIAIQCASKLPPGCKVYFQFSLPGKNTAIRLSGEVVWQDGTGRVGIRFVSVPQSSRNVLKAWLDQTLQTRFAAGGPGGPAGEPGNVSVPLGSLGSGLVRGSGDRRDKSRFSCRLGADVYQAGTGIPNRCTLTDISKGGCYIETPTPFASGTKVEIIVRAASLKLVTKGVVTAQHPGFGMGIRFTMDSATEQEQVLRLIQLVDETHAFEQGAGRN